jgi:hypothetical protein
MTTLISGGGFQRHVRLVGRDGDLGPEAKTYLGYLSLLVAVLLLGDLTFHRGDTSRSFIPNAEQRALQWDRHVRDLYAVPLAFVLENVNQRASPTIPHRWITLLDQLERYL